MAKNICITWVLDLHSVKIMCNANFKIPHGEKSHSLTLSDNFCVNNLEIIENAPLMNVENN